MREGTITFRLVYIVEVLGDGCQHWNEMVEQENRDEGYQRDKREYLEKLMELKQRQAVLYKIQAWTGSQWSCTVVWYVHSGMHELQDELQSLDLSVALWEQC